MIALVRRHFPPSIRAQMTIFYTAVVAFLLLIILVVSYTLIRVVENSQLFTPVNTMANAVAQRISYQNNAICLQTTMPTLPTSTAHTMTGLPACATPEPTPNLLPLTINANSMLRLYDEQEKAVYQSPSFSYVNLPKEAVTLSLSGQINTALVTTTDGRVVAFWSGPLVEQHHIFAVLQLALPVNVTPDFYGGKLVILFVILYPVLVVLGGFGSYALATRAIRPIRRMTQAARAIQAGDLRQRVPVPYAKDDIHTLAQTFNDMTDRLDAAFTQQRRFVSDASHELRTPVAVIRSITDVALAHENNPDEYRAVLREVNAEAERLGKLINMLLGLARVDEGRMPQDREIIKLHLLVADVVESIAPLAAEHQLTLAARRLDEVEVAGDTAQLIQIIMSLAENAINYTPAGGIINLAVVAMEQTANVVVSDTGIGIGPADLPHIFERFYRADPARSRVADGSGLGLALAQEFARAHGGALSVLSREGQGSTFTLTLPRIAP
jgi:signal transduction histidine kinase